MGSDTKRRLDELIETGQLNSDDLASLKRNTALLQRGVDANYIGPEAMQLTNLGIS
jgi:hypothetical protein